MGDGQTAVEWLRSVPLEQWCRAYFPTVSNYDALTNNICESFNNYILFARDKPIITMCEMIRTKIMTRLQTKREGLQKFEGMICPNIMKKIRSFIEKSKGWSTNYTGNEKYEVIQHYMRILVDLITKTCWLVLVD